MEIINYKGIIVIDDFITSEESDGLVSQNILYRAV